MAQLWIVRPLNKTIYYMKSLVYPLSLTLTVLLLCSCASTSSHILIGSRRPPINPSLVKLYLHPPANYEEVAVVSADSRNSYADSAQAKMDVAITNLKAEAAELGANGILLSSANDQYGGSIGSISAIGAGIGSGIGNNVSAPTSTTAFWSGTSFSYPIFNKSAAGIAIYVKEN